MELSRKRREARWFLHANGGSTLGPYDDQRVLEGLRNGEILPTHRIYSAQDGTWTLLSTHPYFRSHPELSPVRRSDALTSPPSPRTLRVKAPAVLPPLPVLPKAQMPEPLVELEAEPVSRMHDPLVVKTGLESETASVAPAVSVSPAPSAPESVSVAEATSGAPEEKGLLETLPIGPPSVVHVEPLVMSLPAVRAAPAFPSTEAAEEIFEEDDLEDLARALEQALVAQPKEEVSATPAVDPSIPARPEIKPLFLDEPRGQYARATLPPASPRVIQIELKMPERAWVKALAFGALIAVAAALGYLASGGNKTRDQKGFHLSDPSSPIAAPQETSDPISLLKAPTRPQRD